MIRPLQPFLLAALLLTASVAANDGEEKKITFDEHIKPILREHCTTCHSESDKESDLALDTYSATLAGGSSGEVIAEGNVSGSRLYALITHAERPHMPPDQDPIAKEQQDLIKTWIEQGMPENAGSKIKRSSAAAAAMLGNVTLGKPEGPPPMPADLLRQPVKETARSAAISALAASPWAPLLAVGGQEQVSLYHSETGQLLGILPFPEGEPQSLRFTRDGRQLLIAGGRHSQSGCAVLVDIETGRRVTKVGDELDTVLAADISPDKSRIAIAGPQRIVRVYDSLSAELVLEMKKHTDWIYSIRYSPDGVLLASSDRSNGLMVWEADSGNLYASLTGHQSAVRSLDFRSDSNVLASASLDGTIKLWDMYEAKEIKSWNAHAGGTSAIAFSHNGQIASAGHDGRVKLWNGNGELQKEYQGLQDSALEVALTGDAAFIAGGDWGGHISLWSVSNPAQTQMIAANPPSIEKRLQLAMLDYTKVQEELSKFDETARAAEEAAAAAQLQAEQSQAKADQFNARWEATQKEQQQLGEQVAKSDQAIRELEQLLAASREQRTQAARQLQNVTKQLESLSTQSQSAAATHAKAVVEHQRRMVIAKEALANRDAASVRLIAAKSAVEQAEADKLALAQRSAELAQRFEKTTQVVQELSSQLESEMSAQAAQKATADSLSQQLAVLQQQLTELQTALDRALSEQSMATSELRSRQAAAEKLKQELELAQQQEFDAREQLELFQKSYLQPD